MHVGCADKNGTRGLGFNSEKTNPAVAAEFSEILPDEISLCRFLPAAHSKTQQSQSGQ